jgi:hypothetical protein
MMHGFRFFFVFANQALPTLALLQYVRNPCNNNRWHCGWYPCISLGAFAKLLKEEISFVMYVRLSLWNTGRIFMKFDFRGLFETLSWKLTFYWNLKRLTFNLHEDQYTFLFLALSVLLRTRNISDKSCRENQNTHFIFNNFFKKSCRLWDNVEKYGRAGETIDDKMAHAHFTLGT